MVAEHTKIPGATSLREKTCDQLRSLCKKHGLETGGVKDVLVSRLVKARKAARSGGVSKVIEKTKRETEEAAPKLRPPSALPAEPNAQQWRTWKQELAFWRRTMKGSHSEEAMLQCLLTALPECAKRVLFSQLEVESMSLQALLQVLQREYGQDEVLEARDALREYRDCKRVASESLVDFLKRFRHVRQAAMLAGVLVANSATDTWDLLDACNLSSTQRANVTSQLQVRMELQPEVPEFDQCERLLLNLARALGSEPQGGTKQQEVALFGAEARGKGEEPSGGHWKSGLKWKTHGGKKGKKGKKGSGKGSWGKNKDKDSGKNKDTGKNKDSWEKKVDWLCPKCGARCWGSKDSCFKCGQQKPADATPAPRRW